MGHPRKTPSQRRILLGTRSSLSLPQKQQCVETQCGIKGTTPGPRVGSLLRKTKGCEPTKKRPTQQKKGLRNTSNPCPLNLRNKSEEEKEGGEKRGRARAG